MLEEHTSVQRILHQIDKLQEAYTLYEQESLQYYLNNTIGIRERQLLSLFQNREVVTIREVTLLLSLPNSTVTSILNRMEKSSLLKRRLKQEDRRAYELVLTEQGKKTLDILMAIKKSWVARTTELFQQEDFDMAFQLLDKMIGELPAIVLDGSRRYEMDILKQEYDQFGNWIAKIEDESEVPPQFNREKDRILNGLQAYKFPIDVARRELKPGMPMYEKVLVLNESYLELMERQDNLIRSTTINYDEIRALEKIHDLLSGELRISAGTGDFLLSYNPVSEDVMDGIVNWIRDKYQDKSHIVDLEVDNELEMIDTPLYRNLLSEMNKTENVQALQYQPFIQLEHQKKNSWTTILQLMNKPVLQESLFMTNGYELLIFSRVKEVKKNAEADYGYRKLFVPLNYIDDISVFEDIYFEDLWNLELHIGNHTKVIKIGKEIQLDRLEVSIRKYQYSKNA